MGKRVYLVTGGAGFVGANLCRRLAEQGEEVHLFVRPTTDLWRLADIADRLRLHTVDIRDAVDVAAAVEDIKPSVIYHLATHGAYHYQRDADTILLVNVFGFWNLINACERTGYELFVNTGSSSEYGRKEFAMRETDNLEPDSYYAVAKSAQSLLARLCSRMSDRPIVTLRLFSVYGPYEEPTRLIPRVMAAALFGEPIRMVDPSTARDFVYVDDVVNAFLDFENLSGLRGEILNVGTGVQSNLRDVIETTQTLVNHPLPVEWGAMPARPWDSDRWVADASKLRRLTGACPRTTLREGLEKCLGWFADHRDLYRPGTPPEC